MTLDVEERGEETVELALPSLFCSILFSCFPASLIVNRVFRTGTNLQSRAEAQEPHRAWNVVERAYSASC